jgi:L-glutamine-phosphate cytidylyltransferase
MKGIILAAGRGSRMGVLTASETKCMTQVHGRSLLDWQMKSLHAAGVGSIGIVVGYLRETFKLDVPYFVNGRWAETQMVMSLAAADEWLSTDTTIVSYSDIVYGEGTVEALMACDGDIAITFDPEWRALWEARFAEPLADAETFVTDDRGVLTEIGGKTSNIQDIRGQYMGLLKFTPQGWREVVAVLDELPTERRDKLDMTSLLQRLIERGVEIQTVPKKGPWCEVDEPTDIAVAERVMTA